MTKRKLRKLRIKAARNKAKVTSVLVLFAGSILLMISFIFNHQAVTALLLGTAVNWFGLLINPYFILDISYILFGVSYFLCVLVFVLALLFKWKR